VWDRPKQGFVLPFAQWMRGPMAAEVGSALGDAAAVAMAGLDRRAVGDVWNGFVANQPGMTWSRPWALYALVRWAAAVGIDGLVSDLPDEPEALAG
jgi:asparagine synthase (glutamine-hydrolysing)